MTKTNEMSPHFRKTVAEIDGDINKLLGDVGRLKTTRETIVELYGGETEIEATPPPLKKARKKTEAVPEAGAPKATPEAFALIGKVRALPEPFTAESLRVGADLPDLKTASNRLTIWFKKGWVNRVGRGAYNRSKTFGT